MPRETGEHTKEKLRIIAQYLPVYLQATKNVMERIYIDAFAGPGRNKIKPSGEIVDGSPLIALKSVAKNGTLFDRYYFIEMAPKVAAELQNSLEQSRPGGPWEVIPGDVNTELPKLMKKIHPRSPTFVLLDTEGIEPAWTTIESLSKWQTELLINFPLGMGINRNTGSAKVTRYFGTDEWKPIWHGSNQGEAKPLIDLYKNRLADLGWKFPSRLDKRISTVRGQSLYYLIHVSKVKAAGRIMDWVAKQPDSSGQSQMILDLGSDDARGN
jgi:three-Cys-motif partner protein